MTRDRPDDIAVSWHDNLIYALHIHAPDPTAGDWRSELTFDIDHIVEWVCGTDQRPKFHVAPATLIFHDVTDLSIQLDMSGNAALALNELSIDGISRAPAPHPGMVPTLPYYRWHIALNLPRNGELSFGASDFTQTLRAKPILIAEQRLAARTRPQLFRAGTHLG